jgi:hypothetical protein
MKSILCGNGTNIQFSNKNKSGSVYNGVNSFIRVMDGIKNDRFRVISPTATTLHFKTYIDMLVEVMNGIVKGKYDSLARTEDEKIVLLDIKARYTNDIKPEYISFEDYFYFVRIANNKFEDGKDIRLSYFQILLQMLLDAIYNDGKIELLYKQMPKEFKDYLCDFDNILTVNYDNNLENLTGKKVLHLHGDFDILEPSYDRSTFYGYMRELNHELLPVPDGFKHICCNALMGFSGESKLEAAAVYTKNNFILDRLADYFKVHKDEIPKLKENNYPVFTDVMAKMLNSAYYPVYYPFGSLTKLVDSIVILGLSPNNDLHLFNLIDKNKRIDQITYIYTNTADADIMKRIFGERLSAVPATTYWTSLNITSNIS